MTISLLFNLKGHEDWGSTLGFSADGTTLMSVGSLRQGNTNRSWDIDSNKEFAPMMLPQLSGIQASTFSPDGKTLAGVTDNYEYDRVVGTFKPAPDAQPL